MVHNLTTHLFTEHSIVRFRRVVYNYGNSVKPYDEAKNVFTAPVTGWYEFGMFFHWNNRKTTTLVKTESFGLFTYANNNLIPRALFWVDEHHDIHTSKNMVTAVFLQKGEMVAAAFRGTVLSGASTAWNDPE
jgi:hypothetical protein